MNKRQKKKLVSKYGIEYTATDKGIKRSGRTVNIARSFLPSNK